MGNAPRSSRIKTTSRIVFILSLLSQLLIGSRPDQEVTTRIYPGLGRLGLLGYVHKNPAQKEERPELVQACLAVGPRQAEKGAIKAAVEEALLAREEGTPSANDICISMSN